MLIIVSCSPVYMHSTLNEIFQWQWRGLFFKVISEASFNHTSDDVRVKWGEKKALFEQETLNLSDWTVFVFQNWRTRWCTTTCVRIRRSCRAWSTPVLNKQNLQLSVSSEDAYTPWRPREATSVPGELISATKRWVGRVRLIYIPRAFSLLREGKCKK